MTTTDPNYLFVKKEFLDLSFYILNIYNSLNSYCASIKDIHLNSYLNTTTNYLEYDHPLIVYSNNILYQIESVFNEWNYNQENNFQLISNYITDLEQTRLLIEKFDSMNIKDINLKSDIFNSVSSIFDNKQTNFEIPLINLNFSFSSLLNAISSIYNNESSNLQQPINFQNPISNLQPINNNVQQQQQQQQTIAKPSQGVPILRTLPRPASVAIPNISQPPPTPQTIPYVPIQQQQQQQQQPINNSTPNINNIQPTGFKRPVSMSINNSGGNNLRPAPAPTPTPITNTITPPSPTPSTFKKPIYQRPTPAGTIINNNNSTSQTNQQPIPITTPQQQPLPQQNRPTPSFQRPTPTPINKPSPIVAQQRPISQTVQPTPITSTSQQQPTPSFQRPVPSNSLPQINRPPPPTTQLQINRPPSAPTQPQINRPPPPTTTPTPVNNNNNFNNNNNNNNGYEKKKEKDSLSLFGKKLSNAFKGMEISSGSGSSSSSSGGNSSGGFGFSTKGMVGTQYYLNADGTRETPEQAKLREETMARYCDMHKVSSYEENQKDKIKIEDLLFDFEEHKRMWENGKRWKIVQQFVQSVRYTSTTQQTVTKGKPLKGKPYKFVIAEPISMVSQTITSSTLEIYDSNGYVPQQEYFKVKDSRVGLIVSTFPNPKNNDTFYINHTIEADLYRVHLEEIPPHEESPYIEIISDEEKSWHLISTPTLNFDDPELIEFITRENLIIQYDGVNVESHLCFAYRVSIYLKMNVKYTLSAGGQKPLLTLKSKMANCSSYSNCFTSILRYNGVPCRILHGLCCRDHKETDQGLHAQTEFWIDSIGWVSYNGAGGDSSLVRNKMAFSQCFGDLFSNMIDSHINLDIEENRDKFVERSPIYGNLISLCWSEKDHPVSISNPEHKQTVTRLDLDGPKRFI